MPIVGDFVELEQVNTNSKQAFISEILPRKNSVSRPKVANIEQMLIVSSIKEPELDFEQLNRYICFCEYNKIKPILVFNKSDLSIDDEIIEKIFNMYSSLNYEIFFTSAKDKIGIEELADVLIKKTTAFCGMSGVGKTTLINIFAPHLLLKTGSISKKKLRGTHTTRHCELLNLKIAGKTATVVDTPGFQNLKFDFLMPNEIDFLFKEFHPYKNFCKFKDCLHINEDGCKILENIEEFNISRYESYVKFVKEAKKFKEKVKFEGDKKEDYFKIIHNKKMAKISSKKREFSRKKINQEINKSEQH